MQIDWMKIKIEHCTNYFIVSLVNMEPPQLVSHFEKVIDDMLMNNVIGKKLSKNAVKLPMNEEVYEESLSMLLNVFGVEMGCKVIFEKICQ